MSDGTKNNPIGINVDTSGNQVVIAFDQQVQWIELNPRQAIDIAEAIVRKAMKVTGQTESVILTPYNS